MRQLLLLTMTATMAVLLAGCERRESLEGKCHIVGTIPQQYNDKRIFLVPLTGPKTAEYVDSVEVKDGRFEFVKDTVMMAKIVMDYHYRLGLQPLLVVVEPGEVRVTIDSISHAVGTQQNDSLERWKQVTEAHNREFAALRRTDQREAADSVHRVYKQFTRRLAGNLPEGVLRDFLSGLYPLTYKKKLPDGRVVTMNADTNEEVAD